MSMREKKYNIKIQIAYSNKILTLNQSNFKLDFKVQFVEMNHKYENCCFQIMERNVSYSWYPTTVT